MFTVILVQTPRRHFAAMHHQEDQEIDRRMACIFKLLAFNLSILHWLRWTGTLQGLHVGFLIECQNEFIAFQEPIYSLLQP